jgi:threonine dehydratase
VSSPTVESSDVRAALSRIREIVRETPILPVEYHGLRVHLKLELLQHTGSFKPRGVLNKLLSMPRIPEAGCVAASGGNHGIAVAWAAKEMRVKARIYLPIGSPTFKVNKTIRRR